MVAPTPTKESRVSISEAARGKTLAVDTETTGLNVWDGTDYALGLSIAYRGADGKIVSHYFPFRHKADVTGRYELGNYDHEDLVLIKEVIESAPLIAFHNAKFDLTSLESLGIKYRGKFLDTAVMAHLVNENFPMNKQLDNLVKVYVGPRVHKEKSFELSEYIRLFGWGAVPAPLMRHYGAIDAHITFELAEVLYTKLQELGLLDYWFKQKMPLMEVVRHMQLRGIKIDVAYCEKMLSESEHAKADYEDMIGGYNPNSNKDMERLFIDKLGLPRIMRERRKKDKFNQVQVVLTQTFDKEAMELYDQYLEHIKDPVAGYVLAYRGWTKAGSAFYGAYLKHMGRDGRVHPQYKHHRDAEEGGTLTGRLSCAEPNLQQIPKVTNKPWNGGVKQSFIPTPGYELWEVDYSQLELRLGTAYADIESLKKVFEEGRDIFDEMSEELELPRPKVKTLVYSTQYGAGIERLMYALGFTETKARQTRDNYFEKYPGFQDVADGCKKKVEQTQRIKLWSGRYRNFASKKDGFKAMNSLIQGGSADIVERSMIRLWNEVDQVSNNEVRMLLQVHDSVIFEIKQGTAEKWIPKIKEIMADVNAMIPGGFGVKFDVDAKPLHDNYKGDK